MEKIGGALVDGPDTYELEEQFVILFGRSRISSLNLFEHVLFLNLGG